jgi:hypothetical protein
MKPEQKSLLLTSSVVLLFPLTVFLLIVFRDFIYLTIFAITFLLSFSIGSYAVYEVIQEEVTRRSRMHEQLYHGKTAEVRRWLDFFLSYFGDKDLK